jgi:hypothetical protein
MAISDKDFKVKNGIYVNGNAVIQGTVSVSSAPTANSHIATKGYVDSVSLPVVDSTAPSTPENGQMWLDTVSQRLHVFSGEQWIALATLDDASVLQDHIHDTAIDGTGLIVSIFMDAGTPTSTYYWTTDAGSATDTDWADTWSGGLVVDQYN